MSLPSAYSLQKKETKKGMLMFISMPWTMATGTASGPEPVSYTHLTLPTIA